MVRKRSCCILLLIIFMVSLHATVFADATVPTITKNPTSEALAIGGKTWFIAHADNATSISWELVDPNGNVYTLANAMAMNPGLNLQALDGDTIAVSNVPASVNGWGVQATFYGPGGSVSTSPAYIFVGDFLTAYGSVIEKYRIAKLAGVSNYGQAYDYNVSEWISYYNHVGYALKDLDKNGIPELLVAGIDPQYPSIPILFEAYTLVNYSPVQIAISWARDKYYFTYDNKVLNIGSSGASHTNYEWFELNGYILRFVDGYMTDDNQDMSGIIIYHSTKASTTMSGNKYYGDFSIPDQVFPGEYISALQDYADSQCWIPQLTLIA